MVFDMHFGSLYLGPCDDSVALEACDRETVQLLANPIATKKKEGVMVFQPWEGMSLVTQRPPTGLCLSEVPPPPRSVMAGWGTKPFEDSPSAKHSSE